MLTPSAPLLPFSQYYAQLYNYTDPAGNLGGGAAIYFYTSGASDVTAPAVATMTPANSTAGVPVNGRVIVAMSESLDATSMSSSTIQLTPAVAGSLSFYGDRMTVVFTPAARLSTSTALQRQRERTAGSGGQHDGAVREHIYDGRVGDAGHDAGRRSSARCQGMTQPASR